ncbi:DEAD/DEAH box helicase [Nocardia cyriacigeorgica]|uniref:DEAD/DEAH box helicase n=1 Tax=Nocardia cyriacigeorgica TaxID=135487 RepID=UPI001893DEA3|nr:DEAD/DEAH box helicase [Nocardia cyriacigeorgica]MBF6424757.1 DEAD/DEAH box helicase [Nocardia cyriacigeorgica]BDU04084.1 DEAD/DEAH box helicase [Nocardia cyriacigeorgica]
MLNRVRTQGAEGDSRLTHVAELPARAARVVDWPAWVRPEVVAALGGIGITAPWSHQVSTAEFAAGGRHVVVATGTASGKSLGYQLPVLSDLLDDPKATALYIAPSKALGADQLRAIGELTHDGPLRDIHAATYDGDTPGEIRQWVRANARWIFTNPDMLHVGVLRSHKRWARVLRRLRYVVVDECHAYRGVFGSHVALVLRRLRRLAAHYGADPVFVLCSATTADPADAASRLVGAPCVAVTEDGSPRGARTVALWEPPLLTAVTGENGAPVRRAANSEAARIMADLVVEGARTLTFVRSRRGAEVAAMEARRLLAEVDPDLVERVAAYRGGYLPEDRRELEAAISDGTLLAAATTNALELGVDIAGLDAVVMSGFPGTVASFWQQAGRAGRRTQGSLVLLVARDDPLDTYLVHHPEALLDKPVEATITDPTNPYVLGPQLLCAALELPLTSREADELGAGPVLADLAGQGLVRRRENGSPDTARWYVTADTQPHDAVDVRGGIGAPVAIVDGESGRLLGTADAGRAMATLHAGAVHLHQGETYVVDELDLDGGVAFVHAGDPGWTTSARQTTSLTIDAIVDRRAYGSVTTASAQVTVTSQVVGYLRTLPTGEVLDLVELDLPPQTLPTKAVLYTVTPELLERAGIPAARVPGALHAAEHAAIGLLPLVATCDRWDIGGVSIAEHPDTGLPTVFVYDGQPGGAGFADRGFAQLDRWLTATLATIDSCTCTAGCPSCVQSPKCGNGNSPLDKTGAARLLAAVLAELRSAQVTAARPNGDPAAPEA